LWVSGGEAASTFQRADLADGHLGSQPAGFSLIGSAPAAQSVLFAATTAAGRELWSASVLPPRLYVPLIVR
jgi:hypothetical protein